MFDKFFGWLWIKTKGIKPWNGKMWLTPKMNREAKKLVKQWEELELKPK